MALTAVTGETRAGDIDVTINTLGSGQTFYMTDISDFEFKFDVYNPTEDVYDSADFLYGELTITCWNTLSDGSSFANLLETDLTSVANEVDVTLTRPDGTSYLFPFEIDQYNFSHNAINNTVELEVRADTQRAAFPTFGTDSFSLHADGTSVSNDAITAYRFIEKYLAGLDNNGIIIDSSQFTVKDPPSDSTLFWCYYDDGTITYPTAKTLAAAEGAIFGTAFDKSFYVNRTSVNNKVTIPDSQILDIEKITDEPDVKDISVRWFNTENNQEYGTGEWDNTVSETIDIDDDKSVKVEANADSIARAQYDSVTDDRYEVATPSSSTLNALCQEGIDGYKISQKTNGDFLIEIEVFGIDAIKPWEPFEITSSVDRLSDFIGKTYRFSEVTYSFNNKISGTAYQIA